MRERFLIYGAGGMGREVLAHMRERGFAPLRMIDQRASSLVAVEGVPVCELAEAAARFAHRDVSVVIATHSFAHPVAAIEAALKSAGFDDVQTLWTYCRNEDWLPQRGFWLKPDLDRVRHAGAIDQARSLLDDQISRDIFDEQCRLRFAGDYAGLRVPDHASQYDPTDIPAAPEPVRLLDCGAFDGDTVRALRQRGHAIADVIALEPDTLNFPGLQRTLAELGRGRAVQAGVAGFDGELRFAFGQGGASHVDATGDSAIAVVRIDSLCRDYRPNFIKMDIEGAEHDALDGGLETIRRDRPRLAISVYHQPEDLWTLVLKIASWQLGYRFYMRSHGNNGFDTVLYAVPGAPD